MTLRARDSHDTAINSQRVSGPVMAVITPLRILKYLTRFRESHMRPHIWPGERSKHMPFPEDG